MKIIQCLKYLDSDSYTLDNLHKLAAELHLEVKTGGGYSSIYYPVNFDSLEDPRLQALLSAAKRAGIVLKKASTEFEYEKSDFEAAAWLYYFPPIEDDERAFYGKVIAENPFPSLGYSLRPADDTRPYVVDTYRFGRKHILENCDTLVISNKLKTELVKAGIAGVTYLAPEIKGEGKPGSCWVLCAEKRLTRLAGQEIDLSPDRPFRTLHAEDVADVDLAVKMSSGSYELYISQKFYQVLTKVMRKETSFYPCGLV